MNNNYNISKEVVFENTILNVLNEICIKNNKKIILGKDIYKTNLILKLRNIYLDAIVPNGINDDIYTFVEIRYVSNKKILNDSINKKLNQMTNIYLNKPFKLLFITILKNESLVELSNVFKNKEINIEIWGKNEIIKLISDYPIESLALNYANIDLIPEVYLKSINENLLEEKNETYKKELITILANYGISLVLGTGVSLDFKTMNWKEIVNNLYWQLDIEKRFEDKELSLSKIGNDNLSIAEYAKSNMSRQKYAKIMYNALYSNYLEEEIEQSYTLYEVVSLIDRSITKNEKRIKKVITYNYDSFLEILLQRKLLNYNVLTNEECYLNSYLPIYHVHGYLPYDCSAKEREEYSNSIILTENDYFKLYNNSSNWQVVIQLESFKDDICLFIGNSITDFNEKRLLNYTVQKNKSHYAIFLNNNLSHDDMARISAYFFMLCNVKIIWLGSGKDVSKFLSCL